jgi:hypothetical protein
MTSPIIAAPAVRTAPTAAERLERLVKKLEDQRDHSKAVIIDFASKLLEDPSHTFSWGDRGFTAAAELKVAEEILNYIDMDGEAPAENVLEAVRAEALSRALRGARSPSCSTSPTHNLMDAAMTQAWAEFIDRNRHL